MRQTKMPKLCDDFACPDNQEFDLIWFRGC